MTESQSYSSWAISFRVLQRDQREVWQLLLYDTDVISSADPWRAGMRAGHEVMRNLSTTCVICIKSGLRKFCNTPIYWCNKPLFAHADPAYAIFALHVSSSKLCAPV